MIIPVRCVTCGHVLADLYDFYLQEVRKRKLEAGINTATLQYINPSNPKKTIEGNVMDELRLRKICCRRHVLTHVDIL